MKPELTPAKRRARAVIFFVTAALALTGCVRVTYNTTLGANAKLTGSYQILVPNSISRAFDQLGVYPTMANVTTLTYNSWSRNDVADTCTINGAVVTVTNGRFAGFQPNAEIFLYGLTMDNRADVSYSTTIEAVVTLTEDVALFLDDIVISGACTNPGDYISGGRVASGDNFFGIGNIVSDIPTATMISHIPEIDRPYIYALYELELTGGNQYQYLSYLIDDANLDALFADALDHPLEVGELPFRMSQTPGLKAIRSNGAKGLEFTFDRMPIASATSTDINTGILFPNYEKHGNVWVMNLSYEDVNSFIDDVNVTASPASSAYYQQRVLDGYADVAADHEFTVEGVVTETNGRFNPAENSVQFGVSIGADYQMVTKEANPKLAAVLGTSVKFTYKSKSLSKDGKAAVKQAKPGLLRAKNITIVGIIDGTKSKPTEKRKVRLLAQARTKALGKYLAKLGVTAKIKYSYSTLSKKNSESVVTAGQRRAVIQITK